MLLDQTAYESYFKGFILIDCVIRSKDIFYFVLVSDSKRARSESDRKTRIVAHFLKSADKPWRRADYEGFARVFAGASQLPAAKFVGVDRGAQVMLIGSGSLENEDIPAGKQGPIRGGIRKVKTINGYAHVCSGYRGLARRDGPNLWTSLVTNLNFMPDPDKDSGIYGFDDFDAFNDRDFYCVGGRSDVWHFDGETWTQIDFPDDPSQIPESLIDPSTPGVPLEAVCCAGDGYVYIGGPGGTVWKGRKNAWTLIHRDSMSLPFRDMVWFKDRVYCTSDYGLWEIVDDQVRPCDVPDEIRVCSGHLSVGDGVMLLAGIYGAAYHDGDRWHLMFDTGQF
jgi:hypothetical protein